MEGAVQNLLIVLRAAIGQASIAFISGLFLAAAVGWIAATVRNSVMSGVLRTRAARAEARLAELERALAGRDPLQVVKRMRHLEAQLEVAAPRRLSDDQSRTIASGGAPPAGASRLAIVFDGASGEAARFAQDLKAAFGGAPGWNVISEPHVGMPVAPDFGLAVAVSDPERPTATEQLVTGLLADAGLRFSKCGRTDSGADAEVLVTAR